MKAARSALARAEISLAELQRELANGQSDGLPELPGTISDHRRAHKSGRPAKIDTDPDLRAFIEARIDHFTFAEIARQVAAQFPPDRRVGKSAIHAWNKRRTPVRT